MLLLLATLTAAAYAQNESLSLGEVKECTPYLHLVCQTPSSSFEDCDTQIIKHYTKYIYRPLNNHLRNLWSTVNYDRTACERIANQMFASIKKLPPLNRYTLVYRGVSRIKPLQKLAEGQCFSDSAFLSTTPVENIGKRFAREANTKFNEKGYLLKITTFSGKDISKFSWNPREKEVLLMPNTRLRLVKIATGREFDTLEMVEVRDPEECSNWRAINQKIRFE